MSDGHKIPFDTFVTQMKSLAAIEGAFEIDKEGTITTPGKFEGESRYVPYYWEKALDGWADLEDDNRYVFYVFPEDVKEFPELAKKKDVTIYLREDGFVYETTL